VRVGPTLKALREKFPDKLRLAIKQHPLGFHKQARGAARATLAAHEQGRFWEYQDRLLVKGARLDRDSLIGYARELGLDIDRFTAGIDTDRFDAQIDAESAEALAVGASGTPATFINGKKINGAQPYIYFDYAVRVALGENPPPPPERKQKARGPQVDPNKRYPLKVADAPVVGPSNALVTAIAYLDYQ
jgi:protein-disulfide isomerase